MYLLVEWCNMKKLIIINIILVLLIYIVPKEEKKENLEIQENIGVIEEIEAIEEIQEEIIEEQQANITSYSKQCVALIKKYEGCKLQAYKLKGEQYYTIGYGHYGSDVKEGQTITQEQAEKMLEQDLKKYEQAVKRQCNYLELNQNEFDALVSFTYNCGEGSLQKLTGRKTRTKTQIAEKMTAYNNNGMTGLVKRRKEEKNLFLGI